MSALSFVIAAQLLWSGGGRDQLITSNKKSGFVWRLLISLQSYFDGESPPSEGPLPFSNCSCCSQTRKQVQLRGRWYFKVLFMGKGEADCIYMNPALYFSMMEISVA